MFFCSAFPNLPNTVFRFSLTCVVFEIVGGRKSTPPPGVGVRPKPPGVRGLNISIAFVILWLITGYLRCGRVPMNAIAGFVIKSLIGNIIRPC